MGRFSGANDDFIENEVEGEVGWKTGADVLLESVGWIRWHLVRAELGLRNAPREHTLFRSPAVMRGMAGLLTEFPAK
jgi:hypothetical protein